MSTIRNRLWKLFARPQPETTGDLMLGLPLETDGRRIYPVYSRYGGTNGTERGREPAQIGYVEIDDQRAHFVPVEGSRVWLFGLVPIGIAAGLVALLIQWRRRRAARRSVQ